MIADTVRMRGYRLQWVLVTLVLLFPPSLGHIAASARAELLGEWLGQRLHQEVEVRVAQDYAQLEQSITEAGVDLAWAPPAVCARIASQVHAIFKAVRGGQSEYRAALVSRSHRIRSVAELAGRRAAWVDRLSAGGFLLATSYLRANGVDPDTQLAEQRFYGSYATAVRAVLRGDSDFTSVYARGEEKSAARRSLTELVGDRAKHLNVIACTPHAPTDGLVITRRTTATATLAAVERLCQDLADNRRSNLLNVVLDADYLVRAQPDDHAALV
jgi:phosphonate transport system substrate-binding protein